MHNPKLALRNGLSVMAKQGLLLLLLVGLTLGVDCAFAAEVIPPAPKMYFNDAAGVVRPETARQLNQTLEQFERDTSNQIVVAVYPKMQTDSSIEDYTVRIAQSWHVGQKGRDNGAVLFVFIQDHKMFIQVGYGLEGALTDFLCNQIINNEIKPRFRSGDYAGGLTAAVQAMIAATKGEYKGTGRTVAQGQHRKEQQGSSWGVALFFFFWIWVIFRSIGRFSGGGGGPFIFTGGGGSSWGGGGGGDSGGGGFSGGGGSFGGGGAGGDW